MTLKLESSTKLKKITPPGPPGLPIVGTLPFLGKYQYLTFANLAKKYGNVFQIRLGNRPVVVVNGLETLVKTSFKKQGDFAGRPKLYTLWRPAEGGTMGAKSGEPWKRQREIVGKAMHIFFTSKTNSIEQQVMEESAELADIFLNYGVQAFEPEIHIGLAVGSIIHGILFGRRGSPEDREFVNVVKVTKDFLYSTQDSIITEFLPLLRPFYKKSLWKFHNVINVIERLVLKNVENHRDSLEAENLRDITDALLKMASELNESDRQNLKLSEKDIVKGALMELMGAGSEPILTTLLWALLYMIAYPDVQAQIQQELDEVVGKEREVSFKDRGKLPFTEACIHEIMRHASIIPINLPLATTTDTSINGYFILQDTTVFVNLYSLTRDERYWEKPEQFNPYRFLNENGQLKDDLLNKFYPYGIGPRRCLGEHLGRLEVFMFFTNLMQKCKFEKVAGEKLDFNPIPGVFLRPQNYKMIVKPR